jgi:hypothetical protein
MLGQVMWGCLSMSWLLKLTLALLVATSIPVGYVFYSAALSSHDWVYQGHGQWADAGRHGAPGPLVGAGPRWNDAAVRHG